MAETPCLVQAAYPFKGKNNDELNFSKGDVITITQKDEGGWWEGTLDSKTGWFPANYVRDYKGQEVQNPTNLLVETTTEQQRLYRSLILKDITESEKAHVTEMRTLMKTVLNPLGSTDILLKSEYNQVVGTLPVIVDLHQKLLSQLEECCDKPSGEQRAGRIFLSMADQMKTVHTEYCSNHPKAVCILERYKDKLSSLVEAITGRSAGIVQLTAGLSRPFRRLERYSGSLQELERHMEEFHQDRGDTQRSVFLYQQLASCCAAVRRRKEQELDVLCGAVRCWEGEEAHRLGELLYMGPVKYASSASIVTDVKDRHLVLFSQCIVFLSVSQRLSAFVFEGKVPLAGVVFNALDDPEAPTNAFEMISCERLTIACPAPDDRGRLLDLIHKQLQRLPTSAAASMTTTPPSSLQGAPSLPYMAPVTTPAAAAAPVSNPAAVLNVAPTDPAAAAVAMEGVAKSPSPAKSLQARQPQPVSSGSQPNQPYHPNRLICNATSPITNNRLWSMSCLRPSPPLRPCPHAGREERLKKTTVVVKPIRNRELNYEDDVQLLQVVEAYCLTTKHRQTVKSALLEWPQVLIAEEEKMIIEATDSSSRTVVEEKSLVDTVYALRDQMRDLQNLVFYLSRDVEQLKAKNP